jgi:hypothetical protein
MVVVVDVTVHDERVHGQSMVSVCAKERGLVTDLYRTAILLAREEEERQNNKMPFSMTLV